MARCYELFMPEAVVRVEDRCSKEKSQDQLRVFKDRSDSGQQWRWQQLQHLLPPLTRVSLVGYRLCVCMMHLSPWQEESRK